MTHAALNPDLGKTRSQQRALSTRETTQQAKAICAAQGDPRADFKGAKISCSGNIFVGIFFDGTGNNEDADYKGRPTREQKHSNVVRLYHAHPDNIKVGTTGYYAYYIPGVGTAFDEIGDKGGTMGMAAAVGSEARILWGLTRVFNAVSQYVYEGDIIDDKEAADLTQFAGRVALKYQLQNKLKRALKEHSRPEVKQINLSVYGFSRGAAQARAFVNWLYALCEEKDGGWRFAGIPLRVQFLGLFDTVASVGFAGMYNIVEGRQNWASDNLQVHPKVEQCLHLVAAHEVRACFPLDSVRVDGQYPTNAKEYLYPGSHSDVGGGGYMPLCLGKNNWESEDRQLARIPGYEMYCAALAAGVPFTPINKLRDPVAKALLPHPDTVKAFSAYYQAARISSGPVEEMHRQHMSHYFTHRWRWLDNGLQKSPEWARAGKRPNPGANYAGELQWMQATQRSLIQAIAAIMREIDRRMDPSVASPTKNSRLEQPLAGLGLQIGRRGSLLKDGEIQVQAAELAHEAAEYLKKWRKWLQENNQAEVHDTDIEREPLLLLESLRTEPLPATISDFFMNLVHDSMASFIGDGVCEFKANGFGIAKFRRIYAGDNGDGYLRNSVQKRNEERIAAAQARDTEKSRKAIEAKYKGIKLYGKQH